MHDHVIQSIYAIGMALETCVGLVDHDPQGAIRKLRKGIAELNAVIAQLRDYVECGSRNIIKAEQLTEELLELVRGLPSTDFFAVELEIDPTTVHELTLAKIKASAVARTDRLIQPLSPQEQRILPLIAEGKTNKEIATAMGLTEMTVKSYLQSIYQKLRISRRTQAVAWFLKNKRIS